MNNNEYSIEDKENFSLFCSIFLDFLQKEEYELKYVTRIYIDYSFDEFFDIFLYMYFINFQKYSKFVITEETKNITRIKEVINCFFINYFEKVEGTSSYFRTKNIFTLYKIKIWIKENIEQNIFISYNDFCRNLNNIKRDNPFSFILTHKAQEYLRSKLKKNKNVENIEENDKKILEFFFVLFEPIAITNIKKNIDLYMSLKEILLDILRKDEMEGLLYSFADLGSTISEIEENKNKNLNLLIEKYFLSNTIKEDSILL
jgi:hypothetical protein